MHHSCIVVAGIVLFAGCVSSTSLNESPAPTDGAAGRDDDAFGRPAWPSDVLWSDLPPGEALLPGEWNGRPGLDLMLQGRGTDVALRIDGLGDGQFSNGQLLRTDPARVAHGSLQRGDVDGDGRDDLVYLSQLTGNDEPRGSRLTALLQRDASFEVRVTPYEGGAAALALADVDDDGWLDAVVAYGGANDEPGAVGYLRLLRGSGDGMFSPERALPLEGLSPRALAVRPTDTVGAELAVLGEADGTTVVGTLLPAQLRSTLPAPPELGLRNRLRMRAPVALAGIPESWAWSDLDGDGRTDLVVGCASESALHVVLADARRLSLPLEAEGYALGANVAIGDVDGDGNRDLVLPASDLRDTASEGYALGPALLVMYGEGGATFARRAVLQLARGSQFGERAVVADFDGDGQDDLALATVRGDSPESRLGVLLGPR